MGNIGGIQNQQEGGRGKGQKTTNALAPVRDGKTDWGVRCRETVLPLLCMRGGGLRYGTTVLFLNFFLASSFGEGHGVHLFQGENPGQTYFFCSDFRFCKKEKGKGNSNRIKFKTLLGNKINNKPCLNSAACSSCR